MFAAGARQGRGTTLGSPCLYVHSQEDDTSALLPPATSVRSHCDCVARLKQLRGSAWQMLLHLLLYPGTETNLLHPEFNSGFLNSGIYRHLFKCQTCKYWKVKLDFLINSSEASFSYYSLQGVLSEPALVSLSTSLSSRHIGCAFEQQKSSWQRGQRCCGVFGQSWAGVPWDSQVLAEVCFVRNSENCSVVPVVRAQLYAGI